MNQKPMNPAIPVFEPDAEKRTQERRRGSGAHRIDRRTAQAPRELHPGLHQRREILRFGTNKVNLFRIIAARLTNEVLNPAPSGSCVAGIHDHILQFDERFGASRVEGVGMCQRCHKPAGPIRCRHLSFDCEGGFRLLRVQVIDGSGEGLPGSQPSTTDRASLSSP